MMAVRPIQPRELLDLADDLAGRGSGAGKPRTIRLRRSISTSYYALFHELSFRAVHRLLGTSIWGPTEAAVARWVAHTDLATLAKAARAGAGNQALSLALGTVAPDVERIASDFLDLQDARHRADYDDIYPVSKALALGYATTAREAVERSSRLIDSGDPTYDRFLALAMGGVKVAKGRNG